MSITSSLRTISIDGKDYAVAKQANGEYYPITRRNRVGATHEVHRESGQIKAADFDLYNVIKLTGPLSVGQRQGNDTGKCFDQYNVLAMWPGVVTRGPQKQSTTMSSFPSTYTGVGFFEGIGYLFAFGVGGTADDEPIHRWTAGTTTWTNGTLNADDADDVKNIVGMGQLGVTVYALYNTRDAGTHLYASSTDGTTWTPIADATHTNANDRFFGMIRGTGSSAGADVLLSLYWNTAAGTNASGIVRLMENAGSGNWAGSGIAGGDIIGDNTSPRGLSNFSGPDNDDDYIISLKDRCYWFDRSSSAQVNVLLFHYNYPYGSYTGKLMRSPDGNRMFFADGPNLGSLIWTNSSGGFRRDYWLGKLSFPLDAQGDVTAMAFSKANPDWLYFAKSGTAASRNARIYVLNILSNPNNPEVYCIYRNSTAQRVITSMIESQMDDGSFRLMIAEEQAAGGDQDTFFFANLPFHPLENTSYAYTASGTVVDSERGVDLGLVQIGWMAIQADADSLSSTKKLTIRDGQNGTAPANGQDITSSTSPAQVWPDKTDGTAGVGVAGKRQQIEFDILDNAANSTVGPTVKQLLISYGVHNHKPDGTCAEEFTVVLDMDASANMNTRRGNPKNAFDDLTSTIDTLTLKAVIFPGGETIYGTPEIVEMRLPPQMPAGVQQGPSGGLVVVRIQELMR